MKTKNNVQKAILKSAAILFSLVIVSLTVNAQDFWRSLLETSSFNEIALAMVDNSVEASPALTDADAFAAYLEVETEETLELEDWMINEELFNASAIYFEVEAEEALELENWMTNDSYFGNSAISVIEETETELELEDWMLNENLFNTIEENEQPLELESWMTSEEIWRG